MTERKKREIAQERRAAEIAAEAAHSAPSSTSESRFRQSYGVGAWGQQAKGELDSTPSSTAESRSRQSYGIGAWGRKAKGGPGPRDGPGPRGDDKARPAGAATDDIRGPDAPKPVRVSRPIYP